MNFARLAFQFVCDKLSSALQTKVVLFHRSHLPIQLCPPGIQVGSSCASKSWLSQVRVNSKSMSLLAHYEFSSSSRPIAERVEPLLGERPTRISSLLAVVNSEIQIQAARV